MYILHYYELYTIMENHMAVGFLQVSIGNNIVVLYSLVVLLF